LARNGRAIINEDTGFGKRLVAIAAAVIYKQEWPLLIVCPSILVKKWREEFVKWIPSFDLTKIQVVNGAHSDHIAAGVPITIMAYETLLK